MKSLKMRVSTRTIAVIMVIIFILSILPMLWIAKYNHPSADDYSFGLLTSQVWQQTHSIGDVFSAAWEKVTTMYSEWQGTFSAILLMAIQPAVFSESLYPISTFILMGILIFATLFFLKVCLIDYFKASKPIYVIISIVLLFMTVQYTYTPVEAFYWYNGSIYYTFFYSVSLIMFGTLLKLYQTKNMAAKIFCFILSGILAFAVGGSNYSTALCSSVILFFAILYFIVIKKDFRSSIWLIATLAVLLAALIISMMAPGNAIRQVAVGRAPNAIKGILLSFVFAAYTFCNATSLPVVIGWLFLSPFIMMIARRMHYQYKYPLLIVVLAFCVYATQATPPFYAMGMSIPERLINTIYNSYYLFTFFSLFYVYGWISKKWRGAKLPEHALACVKHVLEHVYNHSMVYLIILAILFAGANLGRCAVGKAEDGSLGIDHLPAGLSAMYSIVKGDAAAYDREIKNRLAILNSSETHVTLPRIKHKPELLYYSYEAYSDWQAKNIARYYGKDSVQFADE